MAKTRDTMGKGLTLGRRIKAVDFANIYHRFGTRGSSRKRRHLKPG
jgi:hypothetical protein